MRPRRRPLDPEVERQRQATNAELSALAKHPSWSELESEVVRKKSVIERHLTRRILTGVEPVNQREVDFLRGVMEGLSWLVNRPHQASVSLERYLAENQNVHIGDEE